MIAISGLRRRFGRRAALDGVSFAVAKGTLCALCGGNGAGKTTLLRVIAGYLDSDGGTVTLEAGARLGYLPEGAPLPPELTVAEYVRHRARLVGRGHDASRIARALADVELTARAGDAIGTLSKGLRQRAALAGVLVAGANVLALDEPASGLDEVQRGELRKRLRAAVTAGQTVLWSTHELSDVEAEADQIVVLAAGRVVADGDVAAVKAAAGTGDAPLREAVAVLAARAGTPLEDA
ncbi:MAG TPA: ABC transporter ATP-binding protein [Kofleriaceae bacterium]|nr:ABC transporter ATP-binding protein [Kofleriaceae bacterium]